MRAETATRALSGTWRNGRGIAMCPVHDNHRTPALSLADGEGGRLLVHRFAGCDGADILRELNRRGIGGGDFASAPPAEQSLKPDRTAWALSLWRQARPLKGTIAEQYLIQRGIKPPFPTTLRFHPSLLHAPSQQRYPAMIGLVANRANTATGIHRTFLTKQGRKADVTPSKMMLGECRGGAVRLSDHGNGALLICEGVETGLSLRDGLGGEDPVPRVWAALSTSGIGGLDLSEAPKRLVIAPDGDVPGLRAADKLAERAIALGHEVLIMAAPPGKDWNDVAREGAL